MTHIEFPDEMKRRAARRKSPWNLLLFPLCFGSAFVIGYSLFQMVWEAHTVLYPDHELGQFWKKGIQGRAAILSALMVFPLAPGSLISGFYVGNNLAWFIPPARRAFEREAIGHSGADYKTAQKTLLRIAKWILPIGIGISMISACLLKSLQ